MPGLYLSLEELENYARQHLTKDVFLYYAGGAEKGITLRENCSAFQRWKIVPRCMRGVDCLKIDTSTKILGETISFPICACPTGLHKLGHPDGELATSKGCFEANTCMSVSAYATYSYEEIANACPNGLRWCQMYIFKDRDLTIDFVRRAEASGYKALIVTVDTNPLSKRVDFRGSLELPTGIKAANFKIGRRSSVNTVASEINGLIEPCMSWSDVEWLISITKLPVVLKGIMSVDDAKKCVDVGVQGILVSNKGGRKLDVLPSTLDVLPGIVEAVKGKIEVYIDGGVRSGADVFKALALGADAVFIGRPVIWGLIHKGSSGVKSVFDMMNEELKFIMANAAQSSGNMLRHTECFFRPIKNTPEQNSCAPSGHYLTFHATKSVGRKTYSDVEEFQTSTRHC